jgi:hypothetical protein
METSRENSARLGSKHPRPTSPSSPQTPRPESSFPTPPSQHRHSTHIQHKLDSFQAALNSIDFFLGFPIRIVVVRATLAAHWAIKRDPGAIVGEVVRHPFEGCECFDPLSKEDRGRVEGLPRKV